MTDKAVCFTGHIHDIYIDSSGNEKLAPLITQRCLWNNYVVGMYGLSRKMEPGEVAREADTPDPAPVGPLGFRSASVDEKPLDVPQERSATIT